MSKGSRQRPTDKKAFDVNWDNIFSKKESKDVDLQILEGFSYRQKEEYLNGVFTPTDEIDKDEDKH